MPSVERYEHNGGTERRVLQRTFVACTLTSLSCISAIAPLPACVPTRPSPVTADEARSLACTLFEGSTSLTLCACYSAVRATPLEACH